MAASRCTELPWGHDERIETENQLIERAKNGDREATEELFRRHYQRAYGLAYTLCSGDGEEAKDAVQEAFIKAFRNLNKFKEGAAFYTWLFKIIVNTCIDRKRGAKRWKKLFSFWPSSRSDGDSSEELLEVEDTADSSNPLCELENREMGQRIKKAIMDLPENQRLAFYLKVAEGMKIKEIARTMGSAEGTIKTHLFRAIHSLRESLEDLRVG